MFYEWLGWEYTSPGTIKSALENLSPGETLRVLINSGGGSVMAGQEIYSMLRGRTDVTIEIQSIAGSAASVIAMANRSEISPVGMIMIHNVSTYGASGDYHDMQKEAEILKEMNAALARAYTEKTGKSSEEILKMMDRETWITAEKALELGFVDAITQAQGTTFTNAAQGIRLTDEIRQRVSKEMETSKETREAEKKALLDDLFLYGI